MENEPTLDELIQQTYDWLVAAKYSKGTVYSFKCITNQLKTYAVEKMNSVFPWILRCHFLKITTIFQVIFETGNHVF